MNIELIRGNTRTITLTVEDSGGNPVNLTGKTLVFVAGTTPQIVKKTSVNGSGFVVSDAVNGVAVLELSVTETRNIVENSFDFSIELWESSDTIQRMIQYGKMVVRSLVNVDG